MLFLYYPKCSTCQKAKKWLDANHISYEERHIVEENPTYEELKQWYENGDLPLKKFFNTSGMLYKEQKLKDKLPDMSETAALALTDDSVGIDNPELMQEEKLAIILGTEGEGLMDRTIEMCDYTVKIPMSHDVDSLNVAAASAVAFWQLGKKQK